jgi:hypothetical protein
MGGGTIHGDISDRYNGNNYRGVLQRMFYDAPGF